MGAEEEVSGEGEGGGGCGVGGGGGQAGEGGEGAGSRPRRQLQSYVRTSSVYVILPPTLSGEQNRSGVGAAAARGRRRLGAKMRTKKGGAREDTRGPAPPVRPGSRVAMYEANSQYESRQDASTAPEAAGDAGRRRRSGGRRRGEGTGSRGQPAGLRRCCAGRIAAAPPGEEGMGPGDDIPVPNPATPATPGAPGARKAANYGLIIQHGLATL